MSFKIYESDYEELLRFAKERGVSMSSIIRDAIRTYLTKLRNNNTINKRIVRLTERPVGNDGDGNGNGRKDWHSMSEEERVRCIIRMLREGAGSFRIATELRTSDTVIQKYIKRYGLEGLNPYQKVIRL